MQSIECQLLGDPSEHRFTTIAYFLLEVIVFTYSKTINGGYKQKQE